MNSKWIRTEAAEGDRRGILIPVLIEDVTLPLAFRLTEAAKLIDWDGTVPNPEFDFLLGSVSVSWNDVQEFIEKLNEREFK
ncbi:MAG TPA: hypothetical protein VMW53_00765 [archaeon]|nr:hypothetical protein [archaeon]